MKKGYFLVFFMACLALTLDAQKGFWCGATAGMQNTVLSSKRSSQIDVKNAFRPISTLDVEYRWGPKIAIQSGLGYALYTQNTSKFKNNFNFLVIPFYIKAGGFKEHKKTALSMFVGINYKYLLSANNIYKNEKNSIAEYVASSHTDYTIGLGLKYKFDENLLLETHFTGAYGGNFNNAAFGGFQLTNVCYGLSVGLKYMFSRKK